jgi:hypothetical protein
MALGGRVEIIAAGRETRAIRERVNLASLASAQVRATTPTVDHTALDLRDIDHTSQVLARLQPDIILNCATFFPYTAVTQLPAEAKNALDDAGLGVWLPFHLAPALHLMESAALAGVDSHVINCAYPDAVNSCLDAVGRAPLVGAGNIANNAPAIRRVIADILEVDPNAIELTMVMHHFVSHRIHRHGDSGGAPFHLSWRLNCPNGEVGDLKDLEPAQILPRLASSYRRSGGADGRLMPAAAAVSIVSALIGSETQTLHAPGPLGEVGGLPISISREALTINVPNSLGLNDAQAINMAGQRHDGIAHIDPGGAISLTDSAQFALETAIGVSLTTYPVRDVGEIADHLGEQLQRAIAE